MAIHKTAIINDNTKIGKDVTIGPYSIVNANVEIGDGTIISPHVVIDSNTKIGKNCHIFQYAAIGAVPQAVKFEGEETFVEIGNNTTIREFATIHRGTKEGGSYTKVGNNVLLMAYSHIAHDCIIKDEAILSNSANLAGHVVVGKKAIIGGLVGIHQFVRIGEYAFIGGKSAIVKDIPPFAIAVGDRAILHGLNLIGLKRNNFPEDVILELKKTYRIFFREGLSVTNAIEKAIKEIKQIPETTSFIEFIKTAKRGITR